MNRLFILLVILSGCGTAAMSLPDGAVSPDADSPDGAVWLGDSGSWHEDAASSPDLSPDVDTGMPDADDGWDAPSSDGGHGPDLVTLDPDAGDPSDASGPVDGGAPDSGPTDAGPYCHGYCLAVVGGPGYWEWTPGMYVPAIDDCEPSSAPPMHCGITVTICDPVLGCDDASATSAVVPEPGTCEYVAYEPTALGRWTYTRDGETAVCAPLDGCNPWTGCESL